MPKLDYKKSGVDYDLIDPFKIMAQKAARKTGKNIVGTGLKEVASTRGESCFLIETKDGYIAHVEEGLGTKNLIADKMQKLTGKSYYDNIAQDTVATIVNDLITLGALPISVAMHLAVGDSNWFANKKRVNDLVNGWKKACDICGAVWAGGETPTLKGIIAGESALLGGSAVGIMKKNQLIKGDIKSGDRIILLESSGVHTNGLTLCRKIADMLPQGYKTKLSDGRMYGAALLDASILYAPIIRECHKKGIKIHYTSHITGHGWRKIMRAVKPFVYVIEKILPPQPVFKLIEKTSGLSEKEMYATFNMGVGFALFVGKKDVKVILGVCKKNKIKAIDAGYVMKKGKEKKVAILRKKIEFSASSLRVR